MGRARTAAAEEGRVAMTCAICKVIVRIPPSQLAWRATCGTDECMSRYRSEVSGPKLGEIMREAYANGHRPKYGGTSPREIALWPLLQEHGWLYGLRFVAPSGSFELDFAHIERKLNVEIDGVEHREPRGRHKDAIRDEHLGDLGWQILRIPNEHVDADPLAAIATVLAWVNRLTSSLI